MSLKKNGELMNVARTFLIWCSENAWMLKNVPQFGFVQKAVKKFMPGEDIADAIVEAEKFKLENIGTVFTRLGENVEAKTESDAVTQHYIDAIKIISERNLPTEISLKLTQIGIDLGYDVGLNNFKMIAKVANELNITAWIDIEQSYYVNTTIKFYKEIKKFYPNIGICLQSYLFRTERDFEGLKSVSPLIRLVKGAYKETPDVSFRKKTDTDKNYFLLAKKMLDNTMIDSNSRAAFGTHDLNLIEMIVDYAKYRNIPNDKYEFQMLYGIKPEEQKRLAARGIKLRVLISYGSYWYPWYLRRLAERPANVWFVLKNLFTK